MSLEHNPAKGVRRLRRAAASEYLKQVWDLPYAPRTLAKLACIGGGPEMEYGGRFPLYAEAALDAFARSKLSPPVRSTSERQSQLTTA
jgi:hypothetical protein